MAEITTERRNALIQEASNYVSSVMSEAGNKDFEEAMLYLQYLALCIEEVINMANEAMNNNEQGEIEE
jgi:hypothetical protein